MNTAEIIRDATDRHLGALFFRRVAELGERTFVRLQRGEQFEELSWAEFGAKVHSAVLGLYSLGLAKGARVAILAENRLEWLCADMATLAGGLPNVVVSPSLSEAMIVKILGHSRCRAAFVENEAGAGRLLNLKGHLTSLSHIIVMDGVGGAVPHTLGFTELLRRGEKSKARRLEEILQAIHPHDLATIMYTSGSTGEPKGVMRTHDNLLSNISNGGAIVLSKPEDLCVIVLSLNHLLGRYGYLKSIATGRTTAVIEATEQALDMKTVRALSPTAMTLVPRVMEKIWSTILDSGGNRELWEQLEGLDRIKAETGSLEDDEARNFEAGRAALRDRVRQEFGGRIKYISYGGAPMPPRIMRFFELMGIPLLGSYGSTECGGVTLSGIGENRPGSLGRPFPNVEVRMAEDGEILVRGPTVTPGYFENPEATREVLDEEGWFHTGDLGATDRDGCLRIVGRKKDIFYCSDGTNIYPGRIELLLENDPLVRQAILLGDRRLYIGALLVPDRSKIAAALDKQASAIADGEITALLWSRVEEINGRLEHYERIRKIAVLAEDFPSEVRSVTAFQKIKIDRKAVEDRYQKEIEEIYPRAAEGGRK